MKYLFNEIEQINQLESSLTYSIPCKKSKFETVLKKEIKKGFICNIPNTDKKEVGDEILFDLNSSVLKLSVTNAYIKNEHAAFSKTSGSYETLAYINSIKNGNIDSRKKTYCKKIIPLKSKVGFDNILQKTKRDESDIDNISAIIEVNFEINKLFCLFFAKHASKHYLVIESIDKLTPNDFDEYAWSIIVSLGYVLGNLMQDEEYNFYYNSDILKSFYSFEYRAKRNSLKHIYFPVHSNPNSWIREKDKNIASSYIGKLKEITSTQFSFLCNIVHKEYDIKAILLLIIESLQGSLLIMPAGLSVALEGLTEFIIDKNIEAVKPITDTKLASKFIKELKTVAEKYQEDSSFNSSIINIKIENINSPTNQEKLIAPFVIMGIDLTELDKEVIQYRNAFLHGNINLTPKGKKTYEIDAYEVAMRLLTLINSIIMKMIGFRGYIWNHAKTQHPLIKEDYFKEI